MAQAVLGRVRKFRFRRTPARPEGVNAPFFSVQVQPGVQETLNRDIVEGFEKQIFIAESDGELRMLVNDVVRGQLPNADKDYLLRLVDRRYDELRERKG